MTDTDSPFHGLANKIRGGKSASTTEFEGRKPTLTISRRLDGQNGRGTIQKLLLSHRNRMASSTFTVFVDGEEVGEINNGEKVTYEIEPGIRRVCVSAHSTKSGEYEYEFENGDQLRLKCCAKLTGIALYR